MEIKLIDSKSWWTKLKEKNRGVSRIRKPKSDTNPSRKCRVRTGLRVKNALDSPNTNFCGFYGFKLCSTWKVTWNTQYTKRPSPPFPTISPYPSPSTNTNLKIGQRLEAQALISLTDSIDPLLSALESWPWAVENQNPWTWSQLLIDKVAAWWIASWCGEGSVNW